MSCVSALSVLSVLCIERGGSAWVVRVRSVFGAFGGKFVIRAGPRCPDAMKTTWKTDEIESSILFHLDDHGPPESVNLTLWDVYVCV